MLRTKVVMARNFPVCSGYWLILPKDKKTRRWTSANLQYSTLRLRYSTHYLALCSTERSGCVRYFIFCYTWFIRRCEHLVPQIYSSICGNSSTVTSIVAVRSRTMYSIPGGSSNFSCPRFFSFRPNIASVTKNNSHAARGLDQ